MTDYEEEYEDDLGWSFKHWLFGFVIAACLLVTATMSVLIWQEEKRQSCVEKTQVSGLAFIAGDYAREGNADYRREIATSLSDEANDC